MDANNLSDDLDIMLQSIGDGVIATDDEGRVIRMNPVAEKLTGWRAREAMGRSLTEVFRIVNAETREEVESPVAKVLREGEVVGLANHTLLISRDGRELPIADSGAPIRKGDGTVRGVILVFRDVSEQYAYQEALRESEERLRSIVETVPVGIGILRDRRLQWVSAAICEMTGYVEEELLGRDTRFLYESDEEYERVGKEKYPPAEAVGAKRIDTRWVRKDGTVFDVHIRSTNMAKDDPRLVGITFTALDISERKRAERSLRCELMLNEALAALAKELIAREDLTAIAEVVLAKAKEVTGSGEGFVSIIDPRNGDNICLTLSNMDQCDVEESRRKIIFPKGPDGSYDALWGHSLNTRSAFFTNTPPDHGASAGFPEGHIPIRNFLSYPVVIENALAGQIALANSALPYTNHHIEDIERIADFYALAILRHRHFEQREKMAAQLRQAQKMEAVGTLAGGIAHDFNNILAAILGYAELAAYDLPDWSPAHHQIQQVVSAGKRARDLVRQILAFGRKSTRYEGGAPLQLAETVGETVKFLRASIPTSIEIQHDIDPRCGSVKADATQIHQILMNLGTNAYHAMREKGGILRIGLREMHVPGEKAERILNLSEGRHTVLEVSDTGHGMDKATLEHIFEPYFTTKDVGEGTGMGLAVIHGIVESLGGHVGVYSEPGIGTTFRVYLPVLEKDKDAGQGRVEEDESAPGGAERVLVVDDEAPIVELMRTVLERLGYQVRGMTDSREALGLVEETPDGFDVVVTDMTMPKLNGIELTRRIRAIRADLPVILCTGFSELIDGEKARDVGIKAFLMKPVMKHTLARAIREAIGDGDGS